MKPALPALLLLLAGCATHAGTGWSRAPDLSVYSAMTTFGGTARDHSVLCSGFGSAAVEARWQRAFAAREAAVQAALVARHGPRAVSEAQALGLEARRAPCPEVPNDRWRDHYARLLRLLETRLGLA